MDNVEYILEDIKEEYAVFVLLNNSDKSNITSSILDLIKSSDVNFESNKDFDFNIEEKDGLTRLVIYRHHKEKVPYRVDRIRLVSFSVPNNISLEEQKQQAEMILGILKQKNGNDKDYEIIEEKDENGNIIGININQVIRTKIETEKSIVPVVETEKNIVPVVEEEKSIVPAVETEKNIVPVVEEEKSIVPAVETEKSIVPVVEEEKSIVPVVETEKNIVPVVEEEKSIVPIFPVEEDTNTIKESNMMNIEPPYFELLKGPYFDYGEHYYIKFHYTDDDQKRIIYEEFDKLLLPIYGSLSIRAHNKLEYIMPYLVDSNNEYSTENTGIIGGTSIPKDLLNLCLERFIEIYGFELHIKDKVMSKTFDQDSFQQILEDLETSRKIEMREEYVKQLLKYTNDNNLTFKEYFNKIGEEYQEENNENIPNFELNNPFLKEEDYNILKTENNKDILKYFSLNMDKVINNYIKNSKIENKNKKYEDNQNEKEQVKMFIPIYTNLDNKYEKYTNDETINNFKIDPISGEIEIEGNSCYKIKEEDVKKIESQVNSEEVKNIEVHLGEKNNKNNPFRGMEKFVIYHDEIANADFVTKYTTTRFNLEKMSEPVLINGKICFQISSEDVDYIKNKQNNSYSPFIIETRLIKENKNTDTIENIDNIDNIEHILYRAVDNNNKVYAPKDVLDSFHINVDSNPINIEGKEVYPILESTESYINSMAKNKQNPKEIVRYKDVKLNEIKENENIETIYLFRDISDNNKLYAPIEIFDKFNLIAKGDSEEINGNECYVLEKQQHNIINAIIKHSENPKIVIEYIDVNLKDKDKHNPPTPPAKPEEDDTENDGDSIEDEDEDEKEDSHRAKPHLETIIYKLTNGLSLSTKASKRYRASKVNVAKMGREILTGNWIYNLVSVIPGIAKLPIIALNKLAATITLKKEAKRDIEELKRRLNEELTEEELEIIFQEYRGSQAKADMNPQINDFIAERIRVYVLEKVEKINESLKQTYAELFSYLGQIEGIDAKLASENINSEEVIALNNQRKQLIAYAAGCACTIDKDRKKGIELLSGNGLHGFEEDMKAVSTKMNYVGYRFAKSKEFDNDTQMLLARYGQGFNNAVAMGDAEKIVENFIALEACYSDNTEIRSSLLGKRSVGTKYYTPLVEELDYRDDPFIRNLLQTIAITSAAASAANSYFVHKVEQDKIIAAQQSEANRINSANDAAINQAHQVGKDIEAQQGTMMEGMTAEVNHATKAVANDLERAALDASDNGNGWTLDGTYNAIDSANHTFYNGMYDTVTAKLNDVASRYSSGGINQLEALREMTQIANDTETTLNNIVSDCLAVLKPYASTHPEFDLHSVEETMEYIVNNPDAVINMNNGILDIMDRASTLATLKAEHVQALTSLPSDMLTTLLSATAATGLALHTATTMRSTYGRKNTYGNEVTDMMDEYLDSVMSSEESEYDEDYTM